MDQFGNTLGELSPVLAVVCAFLWYLVRKDKDNSDRDIRASDAATRGHEVAAELATALTENTHTLRRLSDFLALQLDADLDAARQSQEGK